MISLHSLALLTLPLLLPGPRDTGPDEFPSLELNPVEIRLRGGGTATAERGTLRVPIVRSNPDSKIIEVDVWVFRAKEGAPAGAPPVFQLNGGPGWPGLEPAAIDWEGDVDPMIQFSDLVIVGQRGIGTSRPNTTCDMVVEDPMAGPDPSASEEERGKYLQDKCSQCRAHWEALGYDLTGFNVKEAAADVDDIRRLLGYDKIALWGGSFGSHWGMTIMRYHPDAVERALLTGMEGPDHTYDMPSGVLHSLERMAAQAERAPQLAEHIPEEGLIEAFKMVIDSVEGDPFEIEVRGPSGRDESVLISAEALRDLALGYSGRVNGRGGMPTWPADIIRLYRGEFEPAARAIASSGGFGLPTASFFMLDCGSGITPARHKQLMNDPAAKVVGALGWWYDTACAAWGSDLGDDFRSSFVTRIPTVVVHGTWDVSTPFDNALELVPCFENLHFIPVHGGSHGALGEAIGLEPGFAEAIMAFLSTGDTSGLPEEVTLPDVDWVAPN